MSDDEIVSVYPWLMNKARKYFFDSDDANDLAEETVYKVLLNKDKYDRTKPVKSWILAIMHNTYVTMVKRSTFVEYIDFDSSDYYFAESYSHDRLEFMELIRILRRLSSRSLSIECVVYYAKGYSYTEISKLLDIPIGTVMSRIHIARKLLQEELCK